MKITLAELDELTDEAALRAAEAVGYDSVHFVAEALAQQLQLIAERNITEITHGQEDHDQVVR